MSTEKFTLSYEKPLDNGKHACAYFVLIIKITVMKWKKNTSKSNKIVTFSWKMSMAGIPGKNKNLLGIFSSEDLTGIPAFPEIKP